MLRLKPTSRSVVAAWVKNSVDPLKPVAEQELGYLPKSVWANTIYYVERIAEQINSTFQFGSYTAKEADLLDCKSKIRLVIEELIQIAQLKREQR